jgi:hypothetical protein
MECEISEKKFLRKLSWLFLRKMTAFSNNSYPYFNFSKLNVNYNINYVKIQKKETYARFQ